MGEWPLPFFVWDRELQDWQELVPGELQDRQELARGQLAGSRTRFGLDLHLPALDSKGGIVLRETVPLEGIFCCSQMATLNSAEKKRSGAASGLGYVPMASKSQIVECGVAGLTESVIRTPKRYFPESIGDRVIWTDAPSIIRHMKFSFSGCSLRAFALW